MLNLKILVIRLSSMGDVLLTTPLIRWLKNKYPNSTIDIITDERYAEIYKYNPKVNQVIEYSKSYSKYQLKTINKSIIQNEYDFVLDLQVNFRSKQLLKKCKSTIIETDKNRLNKLWLVYFKKPYKDRSCSIPDLHLRNMTNLGLEKDDLGLELWLPEETKSTIYPPFEKETKKKMCVGIAPGAFFETKRWAIDRFITLADILYENFRYDVMLIGGKEDKKITDEIIKKVKFNIFKRTESESIIKTAIAIDKCDVLVCNDTGVLHIAAARQVPVVAIFGSTVPEFGFGPYKVKHKIAQVPLQCRPCTHIGRTACKNEHFFCMKNVSIAEVLKSTVEIIENKKFK